jgi:hypothetical protein
MIIEFYLENVKGWHDLGELGLDNTIIDLLDIIHRPVFLLKRLRLETVSVLRYKPTLLGPIDRANLYLRKPESTADRVGFYLRTEIESSLRNVVFNKKTGRWIMSERLIIVLMIHRHKLLDPI